MSTLRKIVLAVAALVGCVTVTLYLYAHSGGLDANGGHYNHKTGEYHIHRHKSLYEQAVEKFKPRPYPGDPDLPVDYPLDPPVPVIHPKPVILVYPRPTFAGVPPRNVLRIIDGDTLEIEMPEGPETVRLIGVDTPETVHPSKSEQAYGREATEFLKNLLTGERVWVVPGEEPRDKYGRMLAYVYREPEMLFVNMEIVRQGYGFAYMYYAFDYEEMFRRYGDLARSFKRGLWAVPEAAALAENTDE